MAERALIPGDPGYNYSHYWRKDSPKCGLTVHDYIKTGDGNTRQQYLGQCRWPKEPGMPWCSAHLGEMFAKMIAGGYQVEHARAYFAQLGWDAVAIETAVARFTRFLGFYHRKEGETESELHTARVEVPDPPKEEEAPKPKRKPRAL